METVNLIIDVAKCENCHNCLLSDKDEHVDNDWLPYSLAQPKHGQRWIDILAKERGQFPMVDVAYLPTMCNHCRRPPCMSVGREGAVYQRPDGIVIIDPVKARGHEDLVESCPYGHIWWNNERHVPQKWTMNAHLLDAGWKEPRCVQSCPTGAMSFLRTEDEQMLRLAEAEGLDVLHPEWDTGPRVYYRNLWRFTRAFIGGSLAAMRNGQEECVEGAHIVLYQGDRRIAQTVSDNYGDFKLDGLTDNSGLYRLEIRFGGEEARTLDIELLTSTYLGTISL